MHYFGFTPPYIHTYACTITESFNPLKIQSLKFIKIHSLKFNPTNAFIYRMIQKF